MRMETVSGILIAVFASWRRGWGGERRLFPVTKLRLYEVRKGKLTMRVQEF
jgi:hypothetical protein